MSLWWQFEAKRFTTNYSHGVVCVFKDLEAGGAKFSQLKNPRLPPRSDIRNVPAAMEWRNIFPRRWNIFLHGLPTRKASGRFFHILVHLDSFGLCVGGPGENILLFCSVQWILVMTVTLILSAFYRLYLENTWLYTTPIGQIIQCHVTDVEIFFVHIITTLLVFD